MSEGELPERPQGSLTTEHSHQVDQAKTSPENADDIPARLIEQNLFGKLSETPEGEDPAYWPMRVLNELYFYITNRKSLGNTAGLWDAPPRETGERYAPFQEDIRTVKTAYEILAYPHCKAASSRENIEFELKADQGYQGRDQVELNDGQLRILAKLARARNIPFHSDKRVYQYSEVFNPPPDMEKALSGAEFIKWLHEQKRAGQGRK